VISARTRPSAWQAATVVGTRPESATSRTLSLRPAQWPGHRAGQHVDLRLTAEDGYEARRAYSIASAPEDPDLELTIERLEDGEVSPYLADEVRVGDAIEVRGPIGGHFSWSAGEGGPLFMVAGGSGVVPLRAMLRHRAAAGSTVPAKLLLSARTAADVYYADELPHLADLHITLTRGAPPGWTGGTGRVDKTLVEAFAPPPAEDPRTFVCGPTAFVETVANALVDVGHDPARISTERFGPSG
jgi:ferredoxin-NADP reductase